MDSRPAGRASCSPAAEPSLLTVRSRDDLLALRPLWSALDDASSSPCATRIWIESALATLASHARPTFVGLREVDALVALAPLAPTQERGIERLAMPGAAWLGEPCDFVARSPGALTSLVEHVLARRRPLHLHRIFAASPTVEAFRAAAGRGAMTFVRPRASAPYIPLDASWEEPEQHLNSGRRSDLRRAARKAEQAGSTTIEILAPRCDEVDALMDDAIAIEARSWKGTAGTALASDARRAEFFRRYARAAAAAGVLRICFLRAGEQRIAMQIAAEHNHSFWLLKVGYDERFAQASPGQLLMRATIASAARQGFKSFEFLGKAEAWIQVWTPDERPCVSLRVYPRSARGLAALAVDAAASKLGGRVTGLGADGA